MQGKTKPRTKNEKQIDEYNKQWWQVVSMPQWHNQTTSENWRDSTRAVFEI